MIFPLRFWMTIDRLEDAYAERGFSVVDGHIAHCPEKANSLLDLIMSNLEVKTVCEVGFNAGHSAVAFLTARNDTRVISFDIGNHDWVLPGYDIITSM
jgi:predicted O-methyltransferase YrrM